MPVEIDFHVTGVGFWWAQEAAGVQAMAAGPRATVCPEQGPLPTGVLTCALQSPLSPHPSFSRVTSSQHARI
jgi:hypothetical protein